MASPTSQAEFGEFYDCGLAQVFSVFIDYLMSADSCCFCYTYDNRCLISASKRRPRSGFPRF
jgi:hypothetical protein